MTWKRLQDPQLKKRLRLRSQIISLIRKFFVKEGFLEVETPILVPVAGQEPYLNPLKTQVWDDKGRRVFGYLITSPEYSHKKLLAAGFKKIFEITKSFRAGEPWGELHNLEFTLLEWYRARADYTDIMSDVEQMVRYVWCGLQHIVRAKSEIQNLSESGSPGRRPKSETKPKYLNIQYQGKNIDLAPPWRWLTMQEAWEKYAKVEKHAKINDREYLRRLCKQRGYTVQKSDRYDDLFFKIFLTEIEPHLGFPKPVILYEYPVQMAALAQLKPPPSLPLTKGGKEVVWAERFEVYIAGLELANAFSELNDAKEQRKRFLREQRLRRVMGKEIIPLDEDFLDAVGHMPPSAGIAFGIDRLVMLLTDTAKIGDVLTFPAGEIFSEQTS